MTNRSAKRPLVALVLFVVVAWAGLPARAQVESREGIALQNQILELRRQMQALQDQPGRGGGSPTYLGRGAYPPPAGGSSDLVAQLLSRVDALEEQVRQLRGRIDETQNEVQRQGAEMGKRIDDMAFQAQNPQGGMSGGPPPGRGPRRCRLRRRPAVWRCCRRRAPSGDRRRATAGPGPAHAGTGDPGGQCRAGTARLSGRRTGGARGAVRQPHLAARL